MYLFFKKKKFICRNCISRDAIVERYIIIIIYHTNIGEYNSTHNIISSIIIKYKKKYRFQTIISYQIIFYLIYQI